LLQEGEDFENEEASPNKRKKDPHKVDKKYLWPHGLGPPLKNCRKRRFRKTRKKKYVEAPEIEKEVQKIIPLQCNFFLLMGSGSKNLRCAQLCGMRIRDVDTGSEFFHPGSQGQKDFGSRKLKSRYCS
jgi:hypothetical protein